MSQLLKEGLTSPDVEKLQKALGIFVDGWFGPKTEAAVEAFQRAHGLEVDGIVGPKTWAALLAPAGSPKPAPVTPPSSGSPTTGRDPDEGTRTWYRRMWAAMRPDAGFAAKIERDAKTVLANKARYEAVAAKVFRDVTSVDDDGHLMKIDPASLWYVIGGIHFKEASCDFRGCLANGQKIIGTGKKTTIVPIGRGPYATWEESAVDALNGESLGKLKSYEVGDQFYAVERYNGSGYINGKGKDNTSAYLWARTNVNKDIGKYTYDGVYDPNSGTNETSGYAAIAKWLEQNGHIKIGVMKDPALT